MSHEENKNDSQFYYPAINTIFMLMKLILGHRAFIQQIFTESYCVPGTGGFWMQKMAWFLLSNTQLGWGCRWQGYGVGGRH